MLYHLMIIDGTPAGYLAAERAVQAGFNTLLVEKTTLGDICLNEGCIPSKALLNSAKLQTVLQAFTHPTVYKNALSLRRK